MEACCCGPVGAGEGQRPPAPVTPLGSSDGESRLGQRAEVKRALLPAGGNKGRSQVLASRIKVSPAAGGSLGGEQAACGLMAQEGPPPCSSARAPGPGSGSAAERDREPNVPGAPSGERTGHHCRRVQWAAAPALDRCSGWGEFRVSGQPLSQREGEIKPPCPSQGGPH